MNPPPSDGFDRVAGIYWVLEHLAFGGALQRARTCHVARLKSCREILVLGDGDGRGLEAIVRVAPEARVTSVDASAAMLALARRRLTAAGARERVTFEHADARQLSWPAHRFDAVVTMFFLDCFTAVDVAALVAALARSLRPHGVWLFADFVVPERGWMRRPAAACVGALYAFFRWRTGIAARVLPPSEALIAAHGWRPVEMQEFRGGLIRSVAFAAAASKDR